MRPVIGANALNVASILDVWNWLFFMDPIVSILREIGLIVLHSSQPIVPSVEN